MNDETLNATTDSDSSHRPDKNDFYNLSSIVQFKRPGGYRALSSSGDIHSGGTDEEDFHSAHDGILSTSGDEEEFRTSNQDQAAGFNSESMDHTRLEQFIFATLLPDDRCHLFGVPLLEGPFAVRLLKFTSLTYLGIGLVFYAVRYIGWEYKERQRLVDIWTYESNLIAMDILFFFAVGRLHLQRGVDHLAWIFWVLLANLYSSYITSLPFLQHSFTLYEMHCRWPPHLWIFVLLVIPGVLTLIVIHVQHFAKAGIFLQKVVEILLCFLFLLVPLLTSPYFHLHHWFAGWLIGMHCNLDTWWSRATMAWCWGCYINGIAVYGRDPVLTCGYAFYLSEDMRCPFLKCYLDGMNAISTGSNTTTDVQPMNPPNWRNCSADAYHP